MRTIIIYRTESDYAREVFDFLREFRHQTGRDIEELDPDTPDGAHFCRTYDVVEYPTMLALDDTGRLINQWRGRPLPTISEVSFYV